VRRKLGVHPRQIQNRIDLAHEMIGRNNVIEMELIEQLALIALQPPHHRKPPPLNSAGTESLFAANSNRLLQQNLPLADSCSAASDVH
jgi:hypothetical protein